MKHALIVLSLLTALLSTSCARYHFGNELPASQRDLSVPEIQNLTLEESLTPLLKDALRERIMNTTGVRLANEGNETLAISVKLLSLEQSGVTSAKIRNSDASHDKSDSYQTVLYRMTLHCEYTAAPTRENSIPKTGDVTGTADVLLMHDMAVAQETALRELARDTAKKILDKVTLGL